jgi:hypothetical protein
LADLAVAVLCRANVFTIGAHYEPTSALKVTRRRDKPEMMMISPFGHDGLWAPSSGV